VILQHTHAYKLIHVLIFQQLVHQYEDQIKALKLELSMHDTVAQRGSVSYDPLGDEEKEKIAKQVNMFIDGVIPEIQVIIIEL
jgi:kinesin family protein 6/9